MHKILLVCYVSSKIGLGHLSRLLALAQTLKKDKKVIPEFLIFGDLIKKDELDSFTVHTFSVENNFVQTIQNLFKNNSFKGIVFDIYQNHNIKKLYRLFTQLKQQNIFLVGVDSLIEYCDILNLIWIPSFNFNTNRYINCKSKLKSGWDSYLIQKRLKQKVWAPGSKVLVLTGGSDALNLRERLPSKLDKILDKNSEINWVKGPFSKKPKLPEKTRLNWIIHDAPQKLDELILESNFVLTVFGISFFEVLQYGVPTVVFSPYNKKDDDDLVALSKENVAVVAYNMKSAIEELINLIKNVDFAKKLSANALKKMSKNGTKKFSEEIYKLL